MSTFHQPDREYLSLNAFQKEYLNHILSELPKSSYGPWNHSLTISASGCLATGWTANDDIALLSSDELSITEIKNDAQLVTKYKGSQTELLTPNNLEIVLPSGEKIISFGVMGGNGNHVSPDGWKLEIIYPTWPNSVVLLRQPKIPGTDLKRWENICLVKLLRLEYVDLKCGFSNNGKYFMIFGSAGIEVYSR